MFKEDPNFKVGGWTLRKDCTLLPNPYPDIKGASKCERKSAVEFILESSWID